MLFEQVKCRICEELELVPCNSEQAEAKLCCVCLDEYGIDVKLCSDCEEEPITRTGAEYCEQCMESISEEWEEENKQQERDYFNSLL